MLVGYIYSLANLSALGCWSIQILIQKEMNAQITSFKNFFRKHL